MLQLILGEGLLTHKLRQLQADICDILEDLHVGILSLGVARGIELIHLLAEVTPVGVFHEGAVGGIEDGDEIRLAVVGLSLALQGVGGIGAS